jgi:hypothetical protein
MTVGFASQGRSAATSTTPDRGAWVRPPEWLALPTVTTSDQKIVGLYAILPGNNYFAITLTGAYTVDWGDGTTTNTASGVTTYKNLAWASYASSPLTAEGWRQAIITITPQAGQNLVTGSFWTLHNQAGIPSNYTNGWLDIKMSAPNAAGAGIKLCTNIASSQPRLLQQFDWIGANTQNSFQYMFNGALMLQSVPNLYTGAATSFDSMFTGCSSLRTAPALNTSAATSFAGMFSSCSSLVSVPLYNSALVTSMSSMFASCVSLRSVPLFNMASNTTTVSMFQSCTSLRTVPAFNMALVNNTTSMFNGCFALQSLPALNLSSVTTAASMVQNCSSLSTVGALNLSACISTANMFQSCGALSSVGTITTSSVLVSTSAMFQSCGALQVAPNITVTSSVTTWTSMFNACVSLSTVPAYNLTAATVLTNIVVGCTSLQSFLCTNIGVTLSVASCLLSGAAIDVIYGNLKTTTGQTITVTSNYGIATDTPAIATAKGWTVTGS